MSCDELDRAKQDAHMNINIDAMEHDHKHLRRVAHCVKKTFYLDHEKYFDLVAPSSINLTPRKEASIYLQSKITEG